MTDARTEAVDAVYELAHLVLDREQVEWIIDRLILPRVVPCSECGGTNRVACDHPTSAERCATLHHPCPAGCDHGQVSLPPLAVLMGTVEEVLAEVESHYPTDLFRPPPWDGEPSRDRVAAESARHTVALVRSDLYRIASGESSPNTGPKGLDRAREVLADGDVAIAAHLLGESPDAVMRVASHPKEQEA